MANTTTPNNPQYHSWKPEPLVRGTSSILSSSLLTMVLCVWTAVHLNIPKHGNASAQTWKKSGWMVVALLAPEWVVWTAYLEHGDATEIGKIMRKALNQTEPLGLAERLRTTACKLIRLVSSALSWFRCTGKLTEQVQLSSERGDAETGLGSRRHPWTHAHSLYATMGGFAVDTRGLNQSYLPERRQRMTLTLSTLKYLSIMNPELIPDLSESEIRDKSKANAFTKCVTCGQALWFGTQCLTRSAQGLSISLLEINTAVHAACALALYFFFWWDKPLDVEEPTICTHEDIHPMMAFILVIRAKPWVRPSREDIEHDTSHGTLLTSGNLFPHPTFKDIVLEAKRRQRSTGQIATFYDYDYLTYYGWDMPWHISEGFTYDKSTYKDLDELDFECLKLASKVLGKYDLYTHYIRGDALVTRSRNRPKKVLTKRLSRKWLSLDMTMSQFTRGFILAGFFYGGVHVLFWNRSFRGESDELLWKLSSLAILASGIVFAMGCFCNDIYQNWLRTYRRVGYCLKMMGYAVGGIFAVMYVLCRTFIIVECFLDLSHLPDSAFEVPRWSQYFPHIG